MLGYSLDSYVQVVRNILSKFVVLNIISLWFYSAKECQQPA